MSSFKALPSAPLRPEPVGESVPPTKPYASDVAKASAAQEQVVGDEAMERGEDEEEELAAPEDTHLGGQIPERQPWSIREDAAITRLVSRVHTLYNSKLRELVSCEVIGHDIKHWSVVARNLCAEIPTSLRTGKQCRSRWMHHLDPSLNRDPWTQEEEQIIFEAQHRIGNQWIEIAKLLKGRTESSIKKHWYSTMREGFHQQYKASGPSVDGEGSGGGVTLARPGGGSSRSGEGRGDPRPDVVPGGGAGGGACALVGRVKRPSSPFDLGDRHAHEGRSFSPSVNSRSSVAHGTEATSAPALVPLSSFPLGVAPVAEEGRARWQLSDERASADQSMVGSLIKTDIGTLQTTYEELRKQAEGKSGDGCSSRTAGDQRSVGSDPSAGGVGVARPTLDATKTRGQFTGKNQASFGQIASAHTSSKKSTPLPAPASSVGSQDGRNQQNGVRSRPRLFVNTNVDAGMYINHEPSGAEGANAAAAAIAAVRSTVRTTSQVSHAPSVYQECLPRVASSATAAASAAADAAVPYTSSMVNIGNPTHHHRVHHHQQQQQQQHVRYQQMQQQHHVEGTRRRGGGRGGGVNDEYSITIPGTSVRRYMHVQLLLALMSAPGLNVVTPAKVSWDRLGYYPVEALFGPPGPEGHSIEAPRLTPTTMPIISETSPRLEDLVELPPSKRARAVRGGNNSNNSHDTVVTGRTPSTGAMAMPPPQHSPRTSAMLSGLPVSSETAMMLGDAEELQFSGTSPTSFMAVGGMGLMSPYQFPPTNTGSGILSGLGGGSGSDGSSSGGDPSQHFDFAAAIGGIGNGSQSMVPNYNFPELASLYSPNPISPTFGSGRLSPLPGALSPQSLSPRTNWASGF